MQKPIPPTEFILNPDGSIYHLKLKTNEIAGTVILVGDPGRVDEVSSFFDKIEIRRENREFRTHTGYFNGKRMSVMSTGIGTDNIDIAVNELDALLNIDFGKRKARIQKRKLNLIRIGTSGSLQPEIPCDSFVVSSFGLGFDSLMNYYKTSQPSTGTSQILEAIKKHLPPVSFFRNLYLVPGDPHLVSTIGKGMTKGITATSPGFYGPQGRKLRLEPAIKNLPDLLSSFRSGQFRITNFEMETSALYALARLLGHHACTVCAIIANRPMKTYSSNYHKAVHGLVATVLQRCLKI